MGGILEMRKDEILLIYVVRVPRPATFPSSVFRLLSRKGYIVRGILENTVESGGPRAKIHAP